MCYQLTEPKRDIYKVCQDAASYLNSSNFAKVLDCIVFLFNPPGEYTLRLFVTWLFLLLLRHFQWSAAAAAAEDTTGWTMGNLRQRS